MDIINIISSEKEVLGEDPKLTDTVQQMIHEIQRFHITCIDELKGAEFPQHTDLEFEKNVQELSQSDSDIDEISHGSQPQNFPDQDSGLENAFSVPVSGPEFC